MTNPNSLRPPIVVRHLGLCDYGEIYQAMRNYTDSRNETSPDEIWFVQHPPVFTLGRSGKMEHVLSPGDIPVVASDRGGQVTYHGPGQIIAYVLLDLTRKGWGVKRLVTALEQTVIDLCADHNIDAVRRAGAPGVYVNDQKLAALGLRVRKGCSYHGLALNVNMALDAYSLINPCGFPGLEVTQLANLGVTDDLAQATQWLQAQLMANLEYTLTTEIDEN